MLSHTRANVSPTSRSRAALTRVLPNFPFCHQSRPRVRLPSNCHILVCNMRTPRDARYGDATVRRSRSSPRRVTSRRRETPSRARRTLPHAVDPGRPERLSRARVSSPHARERVRRPRALESRARDAKTFDWIPSSGGDSSMDSPTARANARTSGLETEMRQLKVRGIAVWRDRRRRTGADARSGRAADAIAISKRERGLTALARDGCRRIINKRAKSC